MIKLAGDLPHYPARVSSICYLLLMLAGACLLRLPISQNSGVSVSLLDCLFTATSAVSVTGLGVVSTSGSFSLFGQFVILALIQIGGVGIMTLTTFFVFQLREQASLRQQAIIGETLGVRGFNDLRWVLRMVLLGTVIWEVIGAACLYPVFVTRHDPITAIWYSIFHSVSAYCNAGFALQDDSLMSFADNPWVSLVIAGLITAGGIGFPVQLDLYRQFRERLKKKPVALQLHTKLTLLGYAALFVIGFGVTAIFEWNRALSELEPVDRLVAAAFHSVSCRTAGFNSVDLALMAPATLLVSILLMTIGAGSCSCGGGVKVSTVMVLLGHAYARLRGRQHLNLFRRTIPASLLERALASTMVFLVVAGFCLTLLLVVQERVTPNDQGGRLFLNAAFEVVSALGTVGLTVGMTAELTVLGKLLVVVLMFFGRVGPLAVFSSVSINRAKNQLEYASEEPLLG